MTFELAVVQPVTIFGPGSREQNVANARRYVLEAADRGADLVLLPETYPGEWREPIDWTPIDELCDIARDAGVHLVGGFAEPLDDAGSRCYNTLVL
ncbi:MAG: nitrilase-related carbon-nitrogen hydrolase, partial [Trueperaceae bacterium]